MQFDIGYGQFINSKSIFYNRFILIGRILLKVVVFTCICHNAYSQNIETISKSRPVSMSGNLVMNDNLEFLEDSVSNYYYINSSLNTKFFGVIDVPISFAFTNNTLTKNIALPFNRFSLSPSYKEWKAYIGYNSLSFSKYTLSGHYFFGGGLGYDSDKNWSVLGFYGRLRKAVRPDSTTTEAGYRRTGGGLMIGYHGEKYDVSANFIKVSDDEKSVDFTDWEEQYVSPKENFATCVTANVKLTDYLSVSGEYALSIKNTKIDASKALDTEKLNDKYIYHAFEAAIRYSTEILSIGLSYDRLPPNYETLGGYYFSEDEQQVSINLATEILKKINISGDIGFRRDNVEEQNITTNKSLAYSVSLSGNITEGLSFNSSMNNDQNYVNLRDNYLQITKTSEFEDLDTNEYSRLSTSFMLGFNYQIPKNDVVSHSIFTSFNYQKTSDRQRYDTTSGLATVISSNIGYSSTFNIPKITFSANVGYSQTDTKAQNVDIKTYNIKRRTSVLG